MAKAWWLAKAFCFDLYIQYSELNGTGTPRGWVGLTRVLWVWGLTEDFRDGSDSSALTGTLPAGSIGFEWISIRFEYPSRETSQRQGFAAVILQRP
jgi:hypothetical protein